MAADSDGRLHVAYTVRPEADVDDMWAHVASTVQPVGWERGPMPAGRAGTCGPGDAAPVATNRPRRDPQGMPTTRLVSPAL